jgi:hypothetical protein
MIRCGGRMRSCFGWSKRSSSCCAESDKCMHVKLVACLSSNAASRKVDVMPSTFVPFESFKDMLPLKYERSSLMMWSGEFQFQFSAISITGWNLQKPTMLC